MGWSKDPGPSRAGMFPAIFFFMSELSIFIDESGDLGEFSLHSPYYIVSMVFHDQAVSIQQQLDHLDYQLSLLGYSQHCVHTGPIIRNEGNYHWLSITERRKIFTQLVTFIRHVDITYKSFHVEKRPNLDAIEIIGSLSRQISTFIKNHYEEFLKYDLIKVYYDNGQIEISKMLSSIFYSLLPNIQFRRVMPSDYRLFQVADYICSMELIELKMNNGSISHSELLFFHNERNIRKNYLKPIKRKEMD